MPGWWNPSNPWDSISQHVAPGDLQAIQGVFQQAAQLQQMPTDPVLSWQKAAQWAQQHLGPLLKKYWWIPVVIAAIWAGWKVFGTGTSGALQPGPLQDKVVAKLKQLKLPEVDRNKIINALQKDPSGIYVSNVIAQGTYDGAPGYQEVLNQFKDPNQRASVVQTLQEAARLGAVPPNIKFEQKDSSKENGYDVDIEVTEPDGSISAYQLKLIDPSNIASQGTSAANQLVNAKADKKTVIIQLKRGTKEQYQADDWDKKVEALRERYKNIDFEIVFPDGSRIP